MGKKRRKSSSSDSELNLSKRHNDDILTKSSLSDSIAAANSVLYEDVIGNCTMATGSSPKPELNATDVNVKFEQVLSIVKDIKLNQENLSKRIDSKLDKLKIDLTASIDGKISKLRDDIAIDMNRESNRIDQLFTTIQTMQGRIDAIESSTQPETLNAPHHVHTPSGLSNPELCVIATGIQAQNGEDIIQKAKDLITALGQEVTSSVEVTDAT